MSNMVVQTNVLALNSHRNMKGIGTLQSKASQKLSSGFRVNSAADDAAGLAISEKMRGQIRGLDMASKNAQDAISLIQTAEGGMQEIDNMVQRIRELTVYAANDTQDPGSQSDGSNITVQGDRQKIQDEVSALMKEIDSMANRVEFNKKKLINGNFAEGNTLVGKGTALSDAVGAATIASDAATAISAVDSAVLDALSGSLDSAVKAATAGGAAAAISAALATLTVAANTAGGTNSATASALVSDNAAAISGLIEGLTSATSPTAAKDTKAAVDKIISDIAVGVKALATASAGAVFDSAVDTFNTALNTAMTTISGLYDGKLAAATKANGASDAAIAASDALVAASDAFDTFSAANPNWQTEESPAAGKIYFQVGPNASQGWSLNIGEITCKGLGIATGKITEDGIVSNDTTGNIDPANKINLLKMTGEGDLTNLLDTIDNALTIVTTERAKLGAAQNRLEYTMKSLDITSENLSASESRIRDTDMAKEMMNLTKSNVLNQAAISMLAQANQAPQSILQLLQ